jgi:hypothetical protein
MGAHNICTIIVVLIFVKLRCLAPNAEVLCALFGVSALSRTSWSHMSFVTEIGLSVSVHNILRTIEMGSGSVCSRCFFGIIIIV